MQISTRGKNAIKMLLDLANHNDGTPVQSYSSVGMTKQFAESFGIETFFNADSCISVTKKMKIDISDTA